MFTLYLSNLLYPTYLLDILKNSCTQKTYKLTDSIPKFVFLCGKSLDNPDNKKSNRFATREYLRKSGKNKLSVLFAEELWPNNQMYSIDLLTYEHFLADISDIIILFLESMGTASELGAFSTLDELAQKMIILIDDQYENDKSFINDGPVKKIIDLTNPSSVIYCDLDNAIHDKRFLSKLKEITTKRKICNVNHDIDAVKIASYLIEIIDLISLLGPINEKDIVKVYKYIKGFKDSFHFTQNRFKNKYAIGLLKQCGIIIEDKQYLYVNNDYIDKNVLLFDLTNNDFNSLRSKFLAKKYKYLKQDISIFKGLITYAT